MQFISLNRKAARAALLLVGLLSPLASHANEPVRACFVYVSPVGDVGYSYQHDKGRREMEQALAGRVKTSFVDSVAEGADGERVIRDMANSGCRAIFATSFGYMNAMEKVAKQFPKVAFLHATGYKSNGQNLANYNARFYQGRYVNGIVAGKTTKSNVIGYIAAFPIPEVLMGINAFTLGARSVNPQAKVRVIWTNAWHDPGLEREAALSLITQGADILTHHTASSVVVQTAEEKHIHAFAYHSDMSKYAANAQLSATIHEWGGYYTQVMRQILAGTWRPKNIWGGYKEGMIRTAPLNKSVPKDVQKLVAKTERAFKTAAFEPFTGPIKDQNGNLMVPAGHKMSDEELNRINYFVEGVDGDLPKK